MYVEQNTKLHIYDDYNRMRTNFYLVTIRGMSEYIVGFDGENLVEQPIKEAERISEKYKPLISVPYTMRNLILKLFTDAANNVDIKTKDDSVTEGKLIATEKHLQDMRKIISKTLEVEL